jgi:hypothetical protein
MQSFLFPYPSDDIDTRFITHPHQEADGRLARRLRPPVYELANPTGEMGAYEATININDVSKSDAGVKKQNI